MPLARDWRGRELRTGAASLVKYAGCFLTWSTRNDCGPIRNYYHTLRAHIMKPLRIRIFTHASEGPHWLTLLAVCSWLRGGIIQADIGLPDNDDAHPSA